jgi:recombination protein RecT
MSMSASSALKAAATGTEIAKTTEKPKTIASLLSDPAIKSQIALALPKHVTADRLARIALTEVRKVPKLAKCDQTSFLGAIMQCAALGLEPGGALGHCYLIPFENRRENRTEVQFIVGYRGMLDLARRSGQILSLEARAVYAKDHFEVELGLDSKIVHKPAWGEADRGKLTFVYAVAKLKDGGVQFEVMSAAEIEAIRDKSQGYVVAKKYAKEGQLPNSPWATNFDEMAKKTVIRRLFKYLPVSIEIQRAVGMDEQADAGLPQDNPMVLEGQFDDVTPAASDSEQDASNDGQVAGA